MRVACLPALAAATLFLACREPTPSFNPVQPSYAAGAPAACPTHADFVAVDQSTLLVALSAARPRDTIALDGTIEMSVASFDVTTDSITLTCAIPGSGLKIQSGASVNNMIVVKSKGVTVDGLALDSRGAIGGAYLAFFDPAEAAFAEDVRFSNNVVICGAGVDPCAFVALNGATGATVTDNIVTGDGALAGIQLQGVEGGLLERNSVTATSPSGDGIRVNGSSRLVVRDNAVLGPWSASLNLSDGLSSTVIASNRLEGARIDGVILMAASDVQFVGNTVDCGTDECLFGGGAERVVVADNQFRSAGSGSGVHLQRGIDSTRIERNTIIATAPSTSETFGGIRVRDGSQVVVADNVVRGPWLNSIATTNLAGSRFENNRLEGAGVHGIRFGESLMTHNIFLDNHVAGAGSAGVLAQSACGNKFVQNDLNDNGGNVGLILDVSTGANSVVIPRGNTSRVIDNGNFDCNGDGRADPNKIKGPGRVEQGVPFTVSETSALTTRDGVERR